jgi:hypothetical protein
MGLFDYIECEHPLPGLPDPKSVQFQTKDTDEQHLCTYKITPEGRLLYRKVTRTEDRSPKDAPPGSLMSLCGCATPVEWEWVDTNYHGILNFYGNKNTGEIRVISLQPETFGQDLNHPEETEWFEYDAKFTDGQLVEVKRIESASA